MQISNYMASKQYEMWKRASDASAQFWQIRSSLSYRVASDFDNNRQLQRIRPTLVANSLGSRIDDVFGRGPSRLTELRHTKGKTFLERCSYEGTYWRQVLGGGVNLGLKTFLYGAAHIVSFLTLGQIFHGFEPYRDSSEPVISREEERRAAKFEARLAPIMRPLFGGLEATFNYFAGVDD